MISVRQFRDDDYDGAVAVWTAAGRDVVPRSELAIRPSLVLVADAGDGVAGVVMGTYDGRRGWIHRLAVDPSFRRQGIATRLVRALEERFAALGCPRINLLVMPENEAGLQFWRHLGYLAYPDVLCSKPLPETVPLLPETVPLLPEGVPPLPEAAPLRSGAGR